MWLGLDIGTSAVKVVIVDGAGTVVAQARAPLSIARPRPGWSEQDPADWWRAVQAAVAALPAHPRAAVRGVGLTGQMHGAVLLDGRGTVLRPAILWNDGRAAAECAEFEARFPGLRAVSGNAAMPGFTAPKLLWLQRHEPNIFAQVASVLLPKDYVRLLLTGEFATDLSDASGTLWLDVGARRWSAEALAACGLVDGQMPRLHEGNAVTGALLPDIAATLGLPVVPVAAGGGDNAAAAVGTGVVVPGDAMLSLGTSGVIFAVSSGFAPDAGQGVHAFCHALPDRWHQMAVILSAATCLDWAARLGGFDDVASALAAAEATTGNPPVFLPYLSGERTPHNDPAARGVLFNLNHDTSPGLLVRGVMEGVALALADGLDALRATGTKIDRLSVVGGGAQSDLWARILAAVLACQLDTYPDAAAAPAIGAARLARLAVDGEDTASVCVASPSLRTVEPDPALAAVLAPRRATFRRLYPALYPIFQECAP